MIATKASPEATPLEDVSAAAPATEAMIDAKIVNASIFWERVIMFASIQ